MAGSLGQGDSGPKRTTSPHPLLSAFMGSRNEALIQAVACHFGSGLRADPMAEAKHLKQTRRSRAGGVSDASANRKLEMYALSGPVAFPKVEKITAAAP